MFGSHFMLCLGCSAWHKWPPEQPHNADHATPISAVKKRKTQGCCQPLKTGFRAHLHCARVAEYVSHQGLGRGLEASQHAMSSHTMEQGSQGVGLGRPAAKQSV